MPDRKIGILAAGAVLAGMSLGAGTRLLPNPEKVAEAVLYRPTAVPDRVILTLTGDPATTQAVSWRTDTTVAPGQALAQIAPASAYPRFTEKARNVPATTVPLATDLGEAHCHTAEMGGLTPSTLYAYRVGDGVNWSEWFHFRTASARPEPFTFLYFGDAQNDLKSLWSRAIRSAYTEAPRVRLLLHAGDLINRSTRDAEWAEWHGAGGWINGMVNSLPSPGNHEYDRDNRLTPNWRPQFALPTNGPPGLEETCYYIDYQGVRFVSLNSEDKEAEQVAWLEKVLAQNPNRWSVLVFHRPLFSTAKGRDNKELRELWLPVIDRHRVDLVLQGHDHSYGRSHNLRAGRTVRDRESGTVFVVSVSGPKQYEMQKQEWMRRAAENTQLYQIVTVEGGTLKYEARTVTGEIYDAFELKKRGDGANRLVNRTPSAPERVGESSKS